MFDLVVVTSYSVCALAFLGLAGLVALGRMGGPRRALLLAASLTSAGWAGAVAAGAPPLLALAAELLKGALWLHLLRALLAGAGAASARAERVLALGRLVPVAALAGVAAAQALPGWAAPLNAAVRMALVLTPVLGLVALENLLRNAGPGARWGVKHLCLGLGAALAYDFLLFADMLLLGQVDRPFFAARGFVAAMAAPGLAVSLARINRWALDWEVDIHISRRAAFHSMALVAAGVWLMGTAAVGLLVRETGGQWGEPLQVAFMAGGLLVLGLAFASGRVKSAAGQFLRRNFFSYRYDYREEWQRFIAAMSEPASLGLGERIARAMAQMTDSPGAALWMRERDGPAFLPDAAWNYRGPRPAAEAVPAASVVEVDEDRQGLPGWLAGHGDAWAVVPLVHRGDPLAFLVLERPRAPRILDWEDRQLLDVAARQAAGYLAEELASEALRDARRLEDFNRRFAFVAHDVKNVVGQMSLMLDNAQRFGDRPDFRADMLETLGHAVGRLRRLLGQMADNRSRALTELRAVDATALLGRVAERWGKSLAGLELELPGGALAVSADEGALASVLDHLLDNAAAAAGPEGRVCLRLAVEAGGGVLIEVADSGPGMAADFVKDGLFQPLRGSGKAEGWGLGAYQTRHLVREMGGRLEVETAQGAGTRMRILLPAARLSQQQQRPEAAQA